MASIINADNGVVSGSAGLKTSADSTGILALQTNGTTAVTVDTSQNVTFTNSASLPNTFGFKNRLINGNMVIDQRNAGALVSNANGFITDRWSIGKYDPTGGAYSGQQVSDAPTGFVNSLKVTVTTSIAQSSDAYWQMFQNIEGSNSADIGFGTATPSVFTVSFWVKASVTGTYSFAIYNNGQGGTPRSYVTTYTVNTASTWEYKTVTITADSSSGSGFWSTTTGNGLGLYFDLGCGTAQQTTGNTWASVNARRIAGTVRLMATSGATFQITGVQLEKGNIATSFDVRPYGTELALCQRYFEKNFPTDVAPQNSYSGGGMSGGGNGWVSFSTTNIRGPIFAFKVSKRTSPTMAYFNGNSPTSGTLGIYDSGAGVWRVTSVAAFYSTTEEWRTDSTTSGWTPTTGNAYLYSGFWTASAEL